MIRAAIKERLTRFRGLPYRVETEEGYDTIWSVTIFIGDSRYRVAIPPNGNRGTVYLEMNLPKTSTDRDITVFGYVDLNTQSTYPDMETALDVIRKCLSRPYSEILSYMVDRCCVYPSREDIESDPVSYVEYSNAADLEFNLTSYYDRIIVLGVIREYARSLV